MISLSFSNFARNNHLRESGNSYSSLTEQEIIDRVINSFQTARPGQSEKDLTRKILVNIAPDNFYCPPKMPLQAGMKIESIIKTRQEGEDPFVETFIHEREALKYGFKEIKAKYVDVVCYSKEALLENNGERSSDSDWEIVCILATNGAYEPMNPLAMARNYLNKPGGTKTDYSAKDFAESIYYWSCNKGITVKLLSSKQKDILEKIAEKYGIFNLKERGLDSLDFKEINVLTLHDIMKDCYNAGIDSIV